jgi:transposase
MQIQLKAPVILFYNTAIDFRKSIDGLVTLIHTHLNQNPALGIYIFFNRTKDKLKILAWHGNGFLLLYKRLECGKFTIPDSADTQSATLDEKQLSWALAGLDWEKMRSWNQLEFDEYS